MIVWKIYKSANVFKARKFVDDKPTGDELTYPDIELLQQILSRTHIRAPRHANDPYHIIERWLIDADQEYVRR